MELCYGPPNDDDGTGPATQEELAAMEADDIQGDLLQVILEELSPLLGVPALDVLPIVAEKLRGPGDFEGSTDAAWSLLGETRR